MHSLRSLGVWVGLWLGLSLALIATLTARAAEWFTEAQEGTVVTSIFEAGRSVAIRCETGELTLAVGVREADLAAPLRESTSAFVVTTIDPAGDGSTPAFSARAIAARSGSAVTFTLSAKDSEARIEALSSGKPIEFALTNEPGGERFNAFRIAAAEAGEALSEVFEACGRRTDAVAAAVVPPAKPEAPTPTAAPASESKNARYPLGPGGQTDKKWHLVNTPQRVYLFRQDQYGQSLTFDCSASVVSVTLGVPLAEIPAPLDSAPGVILHMRGASNPALVGRVDQGKVGYFSLRGNEAADYLKNLAAGRFGGEIGLKVYRGQDIGVRNRVDFDPSKLLTELATVLEACGPSPAERPPVSASADEDSSAAAATPAQSAVAEWNVTGWEPGGSGDSYYLSAAHTENSGLVASADIVCENNALGFAFYLSSSRFDTSMLSTGAAKLKIDFGSGSAFYDADVTKGKKLVAFGLSPYDTSDALNRLGRSDGSSLSVEIWTTGSSGRPVFRIRTTANGLPDGLRRMQSTCGASPAAASEPKPDSANTVPALAADGQWTFYQDGTDYYAEVSWQGSKLSFACYDGGAGAATFVWFPEDAIPPDVTLLSISFAADQATAESVTYMPNLPRGEGPTRSIVGTPMPDRWLTDARKAKSKIIIGIVPEQPNQKQHALWLEFPATGSTAAMKSFREKCPVR